MTRDEARLGLRLLKIEMLLQHGARCYRLAAKAVNRIGRPLTNKALSEQWSRHTATTGYTVTTSKEGKQP